MSDITVNIRDLFLADEGMLMAELDYSQAESRVVAYLSRDDELKHDYASGVDTHSKVGASLFDKSYEWVVQNKKIDPEAKAIRQAGKKAGHAYNYSMGPKSLMEQYLKEGEFKTLGECKEMLNRMAHIRPAVKRWHHQVEQQLRKSRTLTTPLGMRRYFGGMITQEVMRKAYAFVPQSTVGHLTNLSWLKVYDELGHDVDVLLQTHDSLTVQVPKTRAPWLIPKIAKLMIRPLIIHGDELVIPVDCKVGWRYGSLVELEPTTDAINSFLRNA